MTNLQVKNILIGITGGIAAYKTLYLMRGLKSLGADVRVVLTTSAKQFVTPITLQAFSGHPIMVYKNLIHSPHGEFMKHFLLFMLVCKYLL